jgi:hypothetical protein
MNERQETPESVAIRFDLAAALASLGLVTLAILIWINSASAAIARPSQGPGQGMASCEERLSSLFLAGSFAMPGSADPMQLWVGKARGDDKGVMGVIAKENGVGCEAQCKVLRFERFKKDLKPALMELECEGSTIRTLRMPLHIQWARGGRDDGDKLVASIRMGSSIYGVEEAPLHIQVNRYSVAAAK